MGGVGDAMLETLAMKLTYLGVLTFLKCELDSVHYCALLCFD